jgi:allophanate hydrolase subunit 2
MCPTRASSQGLASALASRLHAIVPGTMQVRHDRANVVLLVDDRTVGGSAAAAILDDGDDRDLAERAGRLSKR